MNSKSTMEAEELNFEITSSHLHRTFFTKPGRIIGCFHTHNIRSTKNMWSAQHFTPSSSLSQSVFPFLGVETRTLTYLDPSSNSGLSSLRCSQIFLDPSLTRKRVFFDVLSRLLPAFLSVLYTCMHGGSNVL